MLSRLQKFLQVQVAKEMALCHLHADGSEALLQPVRRALNVALVLWRNKR